MFSFFIFFFYFFFFCIFFIPCNYCIFGFYILVLEKKSFVINKFLLYMSNILKGY